jgi:hypothetical protein
LKITCENEKEIAPLQPLRGREKRGKGKRKEGKEADEKNKKIKFANNKRFSTFADPKRGKQNRKNRERISGIKKGKSERETGSKSTEKRLKV